MAPRCMLVVGSLSRGGAERQALLSARALCEVGFDASVFVVSPPDTLAKDGLAQGLNVNLPKGSQALAAQLVRLSRAISRENPDAVVTFLRGATIRFALARLLQRRRGAAWLIAERGNVRLSHIRTPTSFALRLYCLNRADRIVVNSPSLAANLIAFDGALAPRTVVVPNVMLPFPVDRDVARRRVLGLLPRAAFPILGTVGSFQEERNYELLANALPLVLNEYPRAHLVVVGRTHGPECQLSARRFEQLVATLGIGRSVTVVGEQPEARELIPGFDAFLLPSKLEGSSNALAEALIAGTAIATAPVADTEQMLGGAGVVSAGWTPRSFAEAVTRVLQSPESYRRLATERGAALLADRALVPSGQRWARVIEGAIADRRD